MINEEFGNEIVSACMAEMSSKLKKFLTASATFDPSILINIILQFLSGCIKPTPASVKAQASKPGFWLRVSARDKIANGMRVDLWTADEIMRSIFAAGAKAPDEKLQQVIDAA